MARGTGATASTSTDKARYETEPWWEQVKDSNVRREQTQEGIKEGRMGGLTVGVTEVVFFQEVRKV